MRVKATDQVKKQERKSEQADAFGEKPVGRHEKVIDHLKVDRKEPVILWRFYEMAYDDTVKEGA